MFEVSRFGGAGAAQLHPLALLIVVAGAALFFALPRRYAIVPFVAPMILMPLAQGFSLGGLSLNVIRLMLLCGWVRLLVSRAGRASLSYSALDKAVVAWVVVSSLAFVALWQDTSALVNRLGLAYTELGLFFVLRFLIQDRTELNRALSALAVCCAVVAVSMVFEQQTGRTWFGFLGGSELATVRDGRIRSAGPFAHPILAGTFGATLVAPYIGLLWVRSHRWTALLGLAASITIVITSASSTPLVAAAAGIVAVCAWPLRRWMRAFRWSLLAGLIFLHLIMKAPVWALIGRLDVVGGSSSYHRYELVNQFIRRFDEWWLVGTTSTAHWGWFLGDTSNRYVEVGVTGGVASLVLFVAIICLSFRQVGRSVHGAANELNAFQMWTLGASLLSHVVAFIGITYWDATLVSWYGLLAMIATAAAAPVAERVKPVRLSSLSSRRLRTEFRWQSTPVTRSLPG